MGATPGTVLPDLSPVKVDDDDAIRQRMNGRHSVDSEPDRQVMSSSPPPMDVMGSPSKAARGGQVPMTSSSARKDRDTEDRSRSASAFSSGGYASAPLVQAGSTLNIQPDAGRAVAKQEDDDGEPAFDLAKGFAPIARGLGSSIGRRLGV